MCPYLILHPNGVADIFRFVKSAFVHFDSYHLYYNISSLLWKGCFLEVAMGTKKFLVMTVFLLIASGLFVTWMTHHMQDLRFPLMASLHYQSVSEHVLWVHNRIQLRAVRIQGGFSLLPCESSLDVSPFRSIQSRFGLPASSSLFSWIELFYMSLFPNVSFLGHLSGMLAGYLYIFLWFLLLCVMVDRNGSSKSPMWISAPSLRLKESVGKNRPNRPCTKKSIRTRTLTS